MARLDRRPSSGLAVYLLPGANALDTADRIKARMRELEPRFPAGLKYAIVYDTTPFVRESVNEVKKTLLDAIILVTIVILVFLQDWKSLLLPVIGVLVSLVGTFAVMSMMGFTLNNLTLFGLVLAIGIVVDDAIVVLENIERWMEKGLPAREATIKAMDEITGPIVAITLVLSSVLLPSAFLSGLVGQFFKQFAVTISVSMLISAINAMTMTPALAVLFFSGRKPGKHGEGKEALPWWSFALFGGLATVWLLTPILGPWLGLHAGEGHGEAAPGGLKETLRSLGANLVLFLPGVVAGGVLGWFIVRPVNWILGFFFRGFNWVFDWATRAYGAVVGWCLRLSAIVLLVYVGLIGLTGFGFSRIPTGFIPMQDKGYLVTNIQLPDSASLERTLEVTDAGRKDRPGDARGRPHALPARHVVRPERQQLQLQQRVHHLQAVPRPARPRARRGRHRGQDPRAAGARGPRGARAGLRGAADLGPGDLRRLQADGGSHRRRGLRRAAGPADDLAAKGNQQPGPGRPVQRLPRPHAAALRGHRPREGQVDGRGAHRRLRHPAGVRGQLLRQRLQPLRPHLAGQRPGRRPLPHRRGSRQAAQGPQRRRRHGAAGGGGRGARQRRAGPDHPLQHVPDGLDQRPAAARDQHRRRPGDAWRG